MLCNTLFITLYNNYTQTTALLPIAEIQCGVDRVFKWARVISLWRDKVTFKNS